MASEYLPATRLHAPPRRYTISQAARACGVTARAIRIYEARGLISPARVGATAMRYYSDEDVAALAYVAQARRAGISISDIAELLDIGRRHGPDAQAARLLVICTSMAAALETQMKELEKLLTCPPPVPRSL